MKPISLLLVTTLLAAVPATAQVVEYYHLDALGNVRVVTDQNKSVIERHDYLPFGEEGCAAAVCGSVTPGQSRRFTAKERDTETGLDYFGARYYGSKIGRFTTVDPVYTWRENLLDPQRWNRYAYARNNPLRYVDPDGRAIDTIADFGFIGYDLFDIGRSVYRGEGVSGTQLGALGADVLGAAIPFATGGGAAFRAAVQAERAVEEARAGFIAANRARGVESEARVLKELGEAKNTAKVRGCEGCSIPDYQSATTIGDIKDAKRVTDSSQLRIQREAAVKSNREHVVQTGTNTRVSKTVQEQSTVRRRDDLGPR